MFKALLPARAVVLLGSMALVVGGAACSASPFSEKQGRCDLRPADDQCTDWRKFSGPSMVAIQGTCSSLASAKPGAKGWEEGETCPTADMLGGCQTKSADGTEQTNWFYKGDDYKSADDVRTKCDQNTTFVTPQ